MLSLKENENAPTVFISYAWALEDNPTYPQDKLYEGYVEKLAKDLERAGCKVLLDRWFDKAGKPLTEFIEQMGHADALIPVGTKLYLYKYEKRAELRQQQEHLVRAEGQILNHIVTYSSEWREKIKPVLFEGTPQECFPFLITPNIPVFFQNNDYFESFFALIRSLYHLEESNKTLATKFKVTFQKLKRQFFAVIAQLETSVTEDMAQAYHTQWLQDAAQWREHIKQQAQTDLPPNK